MTDTLSGGFRTSYPSDIRPGAGIGVQKSGLAVKISADYSNVQRLFAPPAAGLLLLQDPTTGLFSAIDYKALPSSGGGSSLLGNDALPERLDNLYFTPSRARAVLSVPAGGPLSYDATSGLLSLTTTLATMVTSGAYANLTGKPALSAVATSCSYPDLLNKPAFATVVTSGLYSDLTGRPTFAAIATSGSQQRTGFALLLFTGQRVSNVARMSWSDVSLDGEWIRVTQDKTQAMLQLRLHDDLREVMAARPKSDIAILPTGHRRQFSAKGLGNKMADAIGDAGLPDECVTHGLRRAAPRRLA